MKKAFVILVALMVCLMVSVASANDLYASDKTTGTVKVNIAPFTTEIEYQIVDNQNVEFPLITYKDITYFPMTYFLCERLGLEVTYDSAEGLYIACGKFSDSPESCSAFGKMVKNRVDIQYDAVVANYPIYLNGIKLNNFDEEYPILNFRDVTYFPMTWRFAHEEMNFGIEWSMEDYSFKLYKNRAYNMPYAYSDDGKTVLFQQKASTYNNEDESYVLSNSYWNQYSFDLKSQSLTKQPSAVKDDDFNLEQNAGALKSESVTMSVKDGDIYIGSTKVLSLGYSDITGVTGKSYKLGGVLLVAVHITRGDAPAPYTHHMEFLLRKNTDGYKMLDWDTKNNFFGIYAAQNGGYYIASSGYSPSRTSRWTNPFSDIYHYIPGDDELVSFTETNSKIHNSIRVIGAVNGKLYVEAMWYNGDKQKITQAGHFSAINSGYYVIDSSDLSMNKLYSYISGEAFVASDGNLYCIANYARNPRLVNLCTGQVIPFE